MASGWQPRLLASWQTRGPLAWALWPVSQVYRALLAGRRWLYRSGLLTAVQVSVPVLVVGNVVVGGVGKTPVVMALVQHLQQRGWRVGVISRGYGRSGTDCREVLPTDDAAQSGDEALLIRRRTGAPVFVAIRRAQAAQALLKAHPDTQLIVADDGLQHWGLRRDFELCVFDDRGTGNGFLLPAGLLREPWPRATTATAWTLHTGHAPAFGGFRCLRELADHAVRSDGQHIPLHQFSAAPDRALMAVAGIAQPEAFFNQLRARGLALTQTQALPDHFDFDGWLAPQGEDCEVFCTEKDAVKLWKKHPDVLAVPLRTTIDPELLTALEAALTLRLSSSPSHR